VAATSAPETIQGQVFFQCAFLAKAVTPREVTGRVHIFATNFACLVEKARASPNEFALRYLEQRDYHRT
jgi:hypothetical protein